MGAVFEIYVVSKNSIDLEYIFDVFINDCIQCDLGSIKVMNNWNYENVHDIIYNNSEIKSCIQNQKIVFIDARLNGKYHAGIQLYMEGKELFISNWWIDTANISFLDSNFINQDNEEIISQLTHIICQNISKFNIIASALGTETIVNYNSDIENMVCTSSNIVRWIFPSLGIGELKGYKKECYSESNISVYSRFK